MDLHREFVGEYLRTHPPEQVEAMLTKIERDRVIRQRMFAGRVHPVLAKALELADDRWEHGTAPARLEPGLPERRHP